MEQSVGVSGFVSITIGIDCCHSEWFDGLTIALVELLSTGLRLLPCKGSALPLSYTPELNSKHPPEPSTI